LKRIGLDRFRDSGGFVESMLDWNLDDLREEYGIALRSIEDNDPADPGRIREMHTALSVLDDLAAVRRMLDGSFGSETARTECVKAAQHIVAECARRLETEGGFSASDFHRLADECAGLADWPLRTTEEVFRPLVIDRLQSKILGFDDSALRIEFPDYERCAASLAAALRARNEQNPYSPVLASVVLRRMPENGPAIDIVNADDANDRMVRIVAKPDGGGYAVFSGEEEFAVVQTLPLAVEEAQAALTHYDEVPGAAPSP
jgi:hypothetical protein